MSIRLLDTSELCHLVCGKRISSAYPSTFLHAAVKGGGGDPALVSALLSRGAKEDLDTCPNDETLGETFEGPEQAPLHYAAYLGHSRVVQVLVTVGATVAPCSSLTQSIEENSKDAARALLSIGASPNTLND